MDKNTESAVRQFPLTFRKELTALRDGARNGGSISPRRHSGLLVAYERVAAKYRAKIATLRGHGPSQTVDDVDAAITKIAAEFAADLSSSKAA